MNETRQQILTALDQLGREYPDMRFGQLVVNVANWATQMPDSIWDVPDEQFLAAARRHLETRLEEQASPQA